MARVEHQDIRVLPPGSPGIHGAQLERGDDVLRRAARRAAAADQVRRPVMLDGAVVVAEPEGEEALVLGDGAPVLLVYGAALFLFAVLVGDGRGEHAQHGLPLVPPDGVAHEHQPPVPDDLQQPRRVESEIKVASENSERGRRSQGSEKLRTSWEPWQRAAPRPP